MSFNFERIQQSTSFKIVFGLFSIIGVLASLYGGYKIINPSRHHLSCNIISNIKAFEINQEINRLSIYVDSINLSKSAQAIRIYTVQISNDGNDNLLPESYVSKDFKLFVENGFLLEPPKIVNSSNSYIQGEITARLSLKDSTTIILPPVALDIDDYYTLQLSVLYPEEISPLIHVIGKIAGQQDIPVNIYNVKSNKKEVDILYSIILNLFLILSLIVVVFFLVKSQQRLSSLYEELIRLQHAEYKRMMMKQIIESRKNQK